MKTKNIINEEIKRIKSLFGNSRLHGNIINEQTVTGCIEGDCENGKGTYIYDGGGTYVGDFKNGKSDGYGKLTFGSTGNYLEGEWKEGVMHGQGRYETKDGSQVL